jgi:hypothetical protein
MSNTDNTGLMWRKSSYSANGNCVEVAFQKDGPVLIRDTKHPDGGTLSVSYSAWRELIQKIR